MKERKERDPMCPLKIMSHVEDAGAEQRNCWLGDQLANRPELGNLIFAFV